MMTQITQVFELCSKLLLLSNGCSIIYDGVGLMFLTQIVDKNQDDDGITRVKMKTEGQRPR